MFKSMIDKHYRVNMILDNLPVTVYDLMDDVRRLGKGKGQGGTPWAGRRADDCYTASGKRRRNCERILGWGCLRAQE